jgi:hypothetical protein
MVAVGSEWTLSLLRSAHEQRRAVSVPASDQLALASGALAPQPERTSLMEQNAAFDRSLAASGARVSSFFSAPHGRHHLR